ncbi:hypothetical protein KC19_6G146500 [Ceratodon purpureus]|uniref:Uncharacterized protein n=1 Tax=Ceratodon purpureus TaxID=3225 RepID=A0A8T0HI45_CERPU|nr:hypothetical protein KC19_6G146500 [Ceratodon purpureus]
MRSAALVHNQRSSCVVVSCSKHEVVGVVISMLDASLLWVVLLIPGLSCGSIDHGMEVHCCRGLLIV